MHIKSINFLVRLLRWLCSLMNHSRFVIVIYQSTVRIHFHAQGDNGRSLQDLISRLTSALNTRSRRKFITEKTLLSLNEIIIHRNGKETFQIRMHYLVCRWAHNNTCRDCEPPQCKTNEVPFKVRIVFYRITNEIQVSLMDPLLIRYNNYRWVMMV